MDGKHVNANYMVGCSNEDSCCGASSSIQAYKSIVVCIRLPLALVAGEESGVLLEGELVVDLVWRRWGVVALSSA